jgi:hypothetical protein
MTDTVTGWGERAGICNDILKRCTYKPGWVLYVEGDSYTRWTGTSNFISPRMLRVAVKVPDSNDTDKDVQLVHSFEVPPYVMETEGDDDDVFLGWVSHCLLYVERHESREFFKVDGKRYVDPHRDGNIRLYE